MSNILIIDECAITQVPAIVQWTRGDRACVGKRIALQEISLSLLKIVPQVDMKLPSNVTYPFPVIHRGTIKSPDPVKVRFIPVKQEAPELKKALAPTLAR